MYIISDNEATYFEGESLKTVDQLPAGAWGVGYRPMTNAPYFYMIGDYKTSHGKIYGDAESFAKHVWESYDIEKDKNVGALFSGNKGLGKSLTIRLIVEHYIKTKPIIIVDQYTNLLPNVLGDLKDCVVVLDEFEKMFKKNDDEGGMTPQESLLSVLDGTKSLSHNLYLLSVNDTFALDENLISRPGRIRYHFRYENISESAIKEYCKDNLIKSRWNDIENVVDVLRGSRVQSLDIVQSIVKEMNAFTTMSVDDIASIMNISENKLEIDINVVFSLDGHQFTESHTWTVTKGICKGWFDELCYIKFKIKDVSFKPTIIPSSNIQIDRWSSFYPDVSANDPFWAQFKDDEGDVWIPADDPAFIRKHELKLETMTVTKHIDFGTF